MPIRVFPQGEVVALMEEHATLDFVTATISFDGDGVRLLPHDPDGLPLLASDAPAEAAR